MKWLRILEYASYNFAVLRQISLLSGLFYEQCIFIFIQRNFLSKHDQIQNSITKVCFYCTEDTLYWGCTETCQCTKTCHSGILKVKFLPVLPVRAPGHLQLDLLAVFDVTFEGLIDQQSVTEDSTRPSFFEHAS